MTFRKWIYVIVTVLLIVTILIFISETKNLKVNEITLKHKLVNDTLHGTKIVHFADTHFDNKTKLHKITQLVSDINETEPDVIIFTGDMINQPISQTKLNEIDQALSSLSQYSDKLAVLGEMDNQDVINILINNGFTVVEDELLPIYINNEIVYFYGYRKGTNLDALKEQKINKFIFIAMTHNPKDIDQFIKLNPNYIFSSHTHNQEVNIPFVKLSNTPYSMNAYKEDKSQVFITNGTGHAHYPFRFNSQPGFNLYRLLKKN